MKNSGRASLRTVRLRATVIGRKWLSLVLYHPQMGKALDQYEMWSLQRSARLRGGDNLAAPRPVEHFAFFGRKKNALAAADALVGLGYNVSAARVLLKTSLCAIRLETLDDRNVHKFLDEVIAVVESHSGKYDGFGADIAD